MTVVGTAYVELQALADKFGSSLHGSVDGPLHEVGNTAETESGRGRKAFGMMFSTLAQNSNGAMAPVMELGEKITAVNETLGEGHKSAATWALGIGGAATATGAMLTMLGDKDKIAFGQVRAAVESTGKSWEEYEGRMEHAADGGAHYGYSAAQTADALKQLTISTHSPDEALKSLSVTMQIAQTRHISLESAARMVGRVYGGSTMIFRQFGITANQLQAPVMDLAKAQAAHTSAVMANQSAMTALRHVQEKIADGSLKGKDAEDELRMAQEKAAGASDKLKKSNDDLALAQKGTAGQAQVANKNLGLLSERIHGQADAAANTFTGHLKTMGADIENTASKIGQKLGPALTMAGPLLMGVGAVMETGTSIAKHFRTAQEGATAATEALSAVQAESAAASELAAAGETEVAVAGAGMDLALAPIIAIGAAIALLAAGVYLAYEHFKPFRDIVNDIGHFFETVFVGAFHAVEHAIEDVPHFFTTVGHDIWDLLKKWGPLALAVLAPFIGIPLLIWQHWRDIEHFAERVWHGVVDKFDHLKHDASDAWNWIWAHTVGKAEDMWHDIVGKVDNLRAGVTRIWHTVEHDASTAWNWVWDHTVGAAEKAPGRIWHAISNGFHNAIHWLENIGSNIIHGLENGITGEAKKLPGQMGHIAKDLIEAPFKSVLSIFSPSGVFDEHGGSIMQGIMRGLDRHAPALSAKMAGIAGSLAATPFTAPAVGPGGVSGGLAPAALGSSPFGQFITDPGQVAALLRQVQSSTSARGSGPMPLLFVAGDLVLRSQQDVDALSRSLFVSTQNIQRAMG